MIGEALRLIRVFHDLSQTALAKTFGVSNSYVSEIESGVKQPTLEMLERYAKTFKIPLSSILFFSESLDRPKDRREQTRQYVSKKVLTILDFIANRSGHAVAKKT